jgi:hypothetical protein
LSIIHATGFSLVEAISGSVSLWKPYLAGEIVSAVKRLAEAGPDH